MPQYQVYGTRTLQYEIIVNAGDSDNALYVADNLPDENWKLSDIQDEDFILVNYADEINN